MKDLFAHNIHRDINGVIKVGQLSEKDVQTELEEYVITRELRGYFNQFYHHYVGSLEQPTDKIGVWIAGFFGSGKSHLLKILSYLLKNDPVNGAPALSYFAPKVEDAMLLAEMERASEVTSDVLLFNIDSKADANSKSSKEAIVQVFMKVFDDHQGYFGTSPQLAAFERQLDRQGHYQAFQDAYLSLSGLPWSEDRRNWAFKHDVIIRALEQSLGMSAEAASLLVKGIRGSYSLSVEQFAGIVREYLGTKPKHHRLIFMVDEVGQYVGENPDLMLNLQTVAEDLGTHCGGRAWIAVTSQEDIDSLTKGRVKGHDFSKIQGRFRTRFSLSSANTDEVIKRRLLEKTEAAASSLRALYGASEQQLGNQIRFSSGTADMPGYRSAQEFIETYPFLPYQFRLLQNVFTQVRTHGASGKHLSQGERSMLEAFQMAAQAQDGRALGSLVPFNAFYPSIEGFLDGSVKQVISHAADNSRLEPFDTEILKMLFMIKYVKEIKGTTENLTTLAVSHIDEKRVELKDRVEKGLARLEKETLIQRAGDAYEFLTNEEQDVGREIKAVQVHGTEVTGELQDLIWGELLTIKKYRYSPRHDYDFSRKLDDLTYGAQTHDLSLWIVTPYGDDYAQLKDDENAMLRSGSGAAVLLRLPDEDEAFRELTTYVQTAKYNRMKNREGLSDSLVRILQDRAAENSRRRERLRDQFAALLGRAEVFVGGNKLGRAGSSAQDVVTAGLKALVESTYTKLNYVKSPFEGDAQIEQVLRDGGTLAQTTDGEAANQLAQTEMLAYLNEQEHRRQTVSLKMLDERFSERPYGWNQRDIQGVLVELVAQGKVELKHAQAPADLKQPDLVRRMWSRQHIDSYTVRVPPTVKPEDLQVARSLANDYLGVASLPSEPQRLFDLFHQRLNTKLGQVRQHLAQAKSGYPFAAELEQHEALVKKLLAETSAAAFFETLRQHQDDFEEMMETGERITSFFQHQKALFDKTKADLARLQAELRHLSGEDLLGKVREAERILSLPDPTRDIPKLGTLLAPVFERVAAIRAEKQAQAQAEWQQAVESVSRFAAEQSVGGGDLAPILAPLLALESAIAEAGTIDAVIARQAEVRARQDAATEAVIEQVNARSASAPEAAPSRPIVTLRPARLAKKTLLESEADISDYLENLREALLTEFRAGKRLKIE